MGNTCHLINLFGLRFFFIVEMCLKSSKHIAEILDKLEDISDNESVDIIIISPDVDCLTDEVHFNDNEVVINDVVDVSLDVCGTFEILTCSDGDNSSKPKNIGIHPPNGNQKFSQIILIYP